MAQLLALMDGLDNRGHVIVIAATNIPGALDPALRRPGRFDREISIPIPDQNARLTILEVHSRGMPLSEDVNLNKLAEITHGFVGADLQALCRESAMLCLRKAIPEMDLGASSIPYDTMMNLKVSMEHFIEALKEIEPSALREVFVEIPQCTLGGCWRTRYCQTTNSGGCGMAIEVSRPVQTGKDQYAKGYSPLRSSGNGENPYGKGRSQ